MKPEPTFPIHTIGHSTHTLEEFVVILQAYDIALLADVRTIPRSRHNPQFNLETVGENLTAAGIEYLHLKELGGLRHPRPDSPNAGWRNDSFRGYADYMLTEPFIATLERLISLAMEKRTAIMCAEAVPWRCHRSLIGDALLVRGIDVVDIYSATSSKRHELTRMAVVRGTEITYPSDPPA
ncbi:DUF488 domain-containing protein [Geomonas sp. RF6]|uniref:DUF488 domain-containing protein n=1 Tax=Geomonas sp. RF6 TaxID=2897342 RepID=UPI001E39E19D|nr:DUF488 domain-containing protein [Geomonas sp. RF6]UFS70198.1 DUF488 domain-containing protein [Geomonas sp. RF6]